ncbi:MAG: hypothetical protein M1831_005522 [Alyxoria varia]|nr:MAG: hypothetical protein M1831_005522 [Alyxoria varia]
MSLGPVGAQVDPKQAENSEDIEKQFAVKAVVQLETYWSLLQRTRGSELRLTKIDDEVHEHLKTEFPDFDPTSTISEDDMKSASGKAKWRDFVKEYEKRVDDFNFGTMLRLDPKNEYSQENTMFAVRMQFYAIEIARNRAGVNDWVYETAQKS